MIADYEPKERMPLVLKGYSIKDHHYDHYDNYDAINVDKVTDIPEDYDGVIGVPITSLKYLYSDGKIHANIDGADTKFDILGITQRNDDPYKIKKYTKEEYKNANDLNARGTIIVNGVPKSTYPRILIKRIS